MNEDGVNDLLQDTVLSELEVECNNCMVDMKVGAVKEKADGYYCPNCGIKLEDRQDPLNDPLANSEPLMGFFDGEDPDQDWSEQCKEEIKDICGIVRDITGELKKLDNLDQRSTLRMLENLKDHLEASLTSLKNNQLNY